MADLENEVGRVSQSSNSITIRDGNATYSGLIDLATGEFSVRDGFYTGVLGPDFERDLKNEDRANQPKITLSAETAFGCTAIFEVALSDR